MKTEDTSDHPPLATKIYFRSLHSDKMFNHLWCTTASRTLWKQLKLMNNRWGLTTKVMKLDAVISSVPVFKIIKMDYLKKLAPNRCRVMIFKQGFNLKMRYIHINEYISILLRILILLIFFLKIRIKMKEAVLRGQFLFCFAFFFVLSKNLYSSFFVIFSKTVLLHNSLIRCSFS